MLKPSLNVISKSMLETAIDVKSSVVVINPAELKDIIDLTDYCRNYIYSWLFKISFSKKKSIIQHSLMGFIANGHGVAVHVRLKEIDSFSGSVAVTE